MEGSQNFSSMKEEEEPTMNIDNNNINCSIRSIPSQNTLTFSTNHDYQATCSSVSSKEVANDHDGHVKDRSDNREVLFHKDCGRERLKRHREEVAGRVMIPETWGQENLLKDWSDCSTFDELLAPKGISTAREALVAEGRRRESSSRLGIASRC